MAIGDHYERMRVRAKINALIRALVGIGYDKPSAIEIVECLLEDAEKDGINTKFLWAALDYVAPISREK